MVLAVRMSAAVRPVWEDGILASSTSSILAPTPPMGWNSWNSFATTITEEQALETAAIMA